MALTGLPTEIRWHDSRQLLTHHALDWDPHPGSYVMVGEQAYLVMERRHRYQLYAGQYQLQAIALYVQPSEPPGERWILDGHWVLGDPSCQFSARSELLRCAVNPIGPCQGCEDYQAMS